MSPIVPIHKSDFCVYGITIHENVLSVIQVALFSAYVHGADTHSSYVRCGTLTSLASCQYNS